MLTADTFECNGVTSVKEKNKRLRGKEVQVSFFSISSKERAAVSR